VVHGQTVRSVTRQSSESLIVRGDGWQVSCGTVILTVGGWVGDFLPREIAPLVRPMRIPVYTFDVAPGREREHLPGRFPVFLYEGARGALVYGLPEWRTVDGGVKIGFHNRQLTPMDIGGERQPPADAERLELWQTIQSLLPGVRSTGLGISCVYTMSWDESFLIGRSREVEGVVYASACSGHGFKFAPAIGEALAQLAIDGDTAVDISKFAPERTAPSDRGWPQPTQMDEGTHGD
jgi:sarcosine oxidase